jgi:hypothetical protein
VRAYLRLDPNLVDHKGHYPDGALAAFALTLCLAEQQPIRGRFKSRKLLSVLLERRGRWVGYLIEHGDLIERDDGRLYVDGWDEWQEGDHTVPDRMRRLRNRKNNGVTAPVTVGTVYTPSRAEAVSGKHIAEAEARNGQSPPQTFMGWQPQKETAHMGQHPDCLVCEPLRVKP